MQPELFFVNSMISDFRPATFRCESPASAVVFLLLTLLLIVPEAFAAEGAQARLDEIAGRVEQGTGDLKNLRAQQMRLEKKLGDLHRQIEELEIQESHLIDELASLREQESGALSAAGAIQERLEEIQTISLSRVRAIYIWGGRDNEITAHVIGAGNDFLRYSLYLRKIREADLTMMRELASLRTLHEERQRELEKLAGEKENVFARLKEQRQKLDVGVREQESISEELRKRRASIENLLTSLKAESLRLEVVLRSMLAENSPQKKKKKARTTLMLSSPFSEGEGIDVLKGRLLWPSSGGPVRGFGEGSGSSFEDYVFSNGLEIGCAAQEGVRSVAKGKVAYIGLMAGYGQVAILDHGRRSYSLYGKLGELACRQGDIIEQGQVLAQCAEKRDPDTGTVYLELRIGNRAVNPEQYLVERQVVRSNSDREVP